MRRLLSFLHTLGAIVYAGGLAAYMLVLTGASDITSLNEYAAPRASLVPVTTWLLTRHLPALAAGVASASE